MQMILHIEDVLPIDWPMWIRCLRRFREVWPISTKGEDMDQERGRLVLVIGLSEIGRHLFELIAEKHPTARGIDNNLSELKNQLGWWISAIGICQYLWDKFRISTGVRTSTWCKNVQTRGGAHYRDFVFSKNKCRTRPLAARCVKYQSYSKVVVVRSTLPLLEQVKMLICQDSSHSA